MKRLIAIVLALVTLIALLPASALVSAATVTAKPFYTLNGSELWDPETYVYVRPMFSSPTIKPEGNDYLVTGYGSKDIKTIAQKTKEDFNNRPEGTRFINLNLMTKAVHGLVEKNVFYDKAVDLIRGWVEEFLAEYSRIGGKLDGITVDLEYIYDGALYIHRASQNKNDDKRYNNSDIYKEIVEDPRYLTEIKPMLEERGFRFLEPSKQTGNKTEIYPISTKDSQEYKIWNAVMQNRKSMAIDESVYQPLIKYYPNALVSDYQVRYTYGWQKPLKDNQTPLEGNQLGVGATSSFNAYAARPTSSMSGTGSKPSYATPPAYNDAVYELTAFNRVLWETNIFKNMYDATESKNVSAHITFFNYAPTTVGTYSNTPYYTESLFHIGLLDPKPFMGYILENEVFTKGDAFKDPNMSDYGYAIKVVNDIMAELTRVAGASDRKPISVPATWNSKFILSGMYAGGRNIWRITPDTSTGVSVEQFKVKDKAPTFYIDGQTITFPQGRIIKDGSIRQVGTCGYWVETPANVMPVITNDADRYSKYPSLLESFEAYKVGTTLDSATALPKATWEVGGNASVQSHGGDNALALSGNVTLKNTKLPANITAGDEYAKQQAWEVTVTLPDSGEMNLLTHSNGDLGIKIANGKVYYPQGGQPQELAGVSLSAGSTYSVKKEVDFRTDGAFKASYSIYDANGNKLGSADNVAVAAFTIPVQTVGISCTNVSGTAYIDDYKLYPTGVTTVLEAYDAATGFKLDGTTSNKDAAYRLSWMNASSEPKVAKVYNNGTLVETIQMAPGQDGVTTGVVKGSDIKFSVTTESGTATSTPNYDSGDFGWTAAAESIGLASGKSNSGNNGGSNNGDGSTATPDVTNPNGGVDAANPSGNGDATTPNGENDATTPNGNQTGDNKPDSSKPNKPNENKGLDGVTIALIVILAVVVLGGGFALLWFIVKPKWLVELKSNWSQNRKKKK